MQGNKKNEFLNPITVLRGVLSLWVILFHYNANFYMHKFDFSFFEPITGKGYYAVDGFFILSGFIVSYVYMEKLTRFDLKNTIKFFILRLVRIYPIHIITIFFYAFIIYVCKLHISGSFTGIDFIYNALLIHSWGVCKDFNWNGPSWSLSTEWFLYLTFPFLTILFSKVKGLKTNILLLLLLFLVEYVIKRQDLSQINFFIARGIVRGFFQFLCGIFIFNIYSVFPKKSIIYDYAFTFIFLSLLIALYFSDHLLNTSSYYSNQDILILFIMGELIFTLSKTKEFILKIFNFKILQWLGLISYSMYMVHAPIGQIAENLLVSNNVKNNTAFMPLYIFLVLVVASTAYKFIELPIRDFVKKKISL